MEFVPFKEEYLPDAAELLAFRHQSERRVFPGLPQKFEDKKAALTAVEGAWKKQYSSGIAAFNNGRMVGYIIGQFISDALRGRHVWIKYEGLAISENEDPELYRNLYAVIAEKWVKNGCFDHFIQLPIGNSNVVDSWFKLGFSHEQVHGLIKLTDGRNETDYIKDVEIRLADASDSEAIKGIADLIMTYQTSSPVWSVGFPESTEKIREGYAKLLEDKNVRVWAAFRKKKLIGFQAYWPEEEEETNMFIPEKCISLGVAGTVPEERGNGIGRILTEAGFNDAIKSGYSYCSTDWRMTNLLSSRFWPKQGFIPVAYRLTRKIDSRIAWATGKGIEV